MNKSLIFITGSIAALMMFTTPAHAAPSSEATGTFSSDESDNSLGGSVTSPAVVNSGGGGSRRTTTRTTTETTTETPTETTTETEVTTPVVPVTPPVKKTVTDVNSIFPDVRNSFANQQIAELYSQGIINGYANGNFGPQNKATRAELIKISLTAFRSCTANQSVNATPFNDVTFGDWFIGCVAKAKTDGIISGYGGNVFQPNNHITRGETLKILLLSAGINISSERGKNTGFSDVSTSHFSAPYVVWATNNGIVNGYGNGRFGPDDHITREQIAKMVGLLITYKEQ